MRARCDPRHRWKPLANPMWGFGERSKSTVSGSGKNVGIEVRRVPRDVHVGAGVDVLAARQVEVGEGDAPALGDR